MSMQSDPPAKGKTGVRVPVQTRAQEKRERIIGAAGDLFTASGYDAVGMRDIAAAAGVSIGTVYAYFADKKTVFIEVLASYSAELKNSFSEHITGWVPDAPDLEGFIYGMIERFYEVFRGRVSIHREAVIKSLTDEQVRSVYASLERQGERVVMDIFVERFGDRIAVRDAEAALFVIHKAIDEIIQYLLFYEVPIDRQRIFRESARMIARYLEKR